MRRSQKGKDLYANKQTKKMKKEKKKRRESIYLLFVFFFLFLMSVSRSRDLSLRHQATLSSVVVSPAEHICSAAHSAALSKASASAARSFCLPAVIISPAPSLQTSLCGQHRPSPGGCTGLQRRDRGVASSGHVSPYDEASVLDVEEGKETPALPLSSFVQPYLPPHRATPRHGVVRCCTARSNLAKARVHCQFGVHHDEDRAVGSADGAQAARAAGGDGGNSEDGAVGTCSCVTTSEEEEKVETTSVSSGRAALAGEGIQQAAAAVVAVRQVGSLPCVLCGVSHGRWKRRR